MPKMSFFIVAAVILIVFVSAALASGRNDDPLDLNILLRAIIEVEGWDGRGTGPDGELGPLQIKPAVWISHSFLPIAWASGTLPTMKHEQTRVGLALLEWIDIRLPILGLPRTAYSIALVYTAGYGNVKTGNISRAKRDYAERVQYIYSDWIIKEANKPDFYSCPPNQNNRPSK